MTNTRIAGTAYDARHEDQVHELARIHTYATRIRSIARKAAASSMTLPVAEEVPANPRHAGHERPSPNRSTASTHSSASSFTIAS